MTTTAWVSITLLSVIGLAFIGFLLFLAWVDWKDPPKPALFYWPRPKERRDESI